ncbi:MAG: hypothetical protein KY397_01510, partial [Gemmatimonadetes bacterium]|nr:hypothetical protein [Gemmatimonadota bacterium]
MRVPVERFRTIAFRLLARRAGWVLAGAVRAMARTWRYEIEGIEHLGELRRSGRGALYCFWHGRMLDLAVAHADREIGVLVS